MAVEIERKYLVHQERWQAQKQGQTGVLIRQGYLSRIPERTVRVRIKGDKGFLTVKGKSKGISRAEFEYPIPLKEAQDMLKMCEGSIIEKTRYTLPIGVVEWEVDEFCGDNAGLIIAEVELQDAEQVVELPDWLGEEVSHEQRYYNARLVEQPFKEWES